MDVELIRWPAEQEKRERLAESNTPRLLLIDTEAPLPEVIDQLEDWIRVPADPSDVRARVSALVQRMNVDDPPHIDDAGHLIHRNQRTALPPVESAIMRELLHAAGKVIPRQTLIDAVWPVAAPNRNVFDVHLVRLRKRLEPTEIRIVTVRRRGLMLDAAARHSDVR